MARKRTVSEYNFSAACWDYFPYAVNFSGGLPVAAAYNSCMASKQAKTTFGDLAPSSYPGERLGLPVAGQRSVARVGRRAAALIIDWAVALLVVRLMPLAPEWVGLANLAVFAILQVLFITTIGGSFGHRLLGMQVVPLRGGWVGVWRPAVRTLLLCLVVPALVWDSDQRAFHDKIAGTVLVRI